MLGAGTTEVSVDTNTGTNNTLGSDGAAGLTVDTVGVELTVLAGSLSLEITSSLEVKVEVDVTVLLDLAKSKVELLLVVDIKILLEVSTSLDLVKVEVEVLFVSDIELLLEVLKSSEVLASLEISGATSVDGLGVAVSLVVVSVSVTVGVVTVVSDMTVVSVSVVIGTMGSVRSANTVVAVSVGSNMAVVTLLPGRDGGDESSKSESLEHFEISIVFGRSRQQCYLNAFRNRDSWELTVRPC